MVLRSVAPSLPSQLLKGELRGGVFAGCVTLLGLQSQRESCGGIIMLKQKKNYRLKVTTLRLMVNDNQDFICIHRFYLSSTLVML